MGDSSAEAGPPGDAGKDGAAPEPVPHDIVALETAAAAAERAGDERASWDDRKRALNLAAEAKRVALVAVLLAHEGDAAMRKGWAQRAVVTFERALAALAVTGKDVAEALQRLADVPKHIFLQGKLEVPDVYTPEAASDLAAEERDPALAAKLLLRIGNAYLDQPQDEVAAAKYALVLAQPAVASEPLLRAHALTAIALIHRRAGRLGEAESTLAEAWSRFDEAGAPQAERRRALLVRAGVERSRGRAGEALATLGEALAHYQAAGEPRGWGRALAALGELHLSEARWDEARQAFSQTLTLAKEAGDGDTTAVASLGLGRCLHREGALGEAAAALEEGLSLLDRHSARLRTEEGKVTFLETAGAAHDELVEVRLAQLAAGEDVARQALSAAERARGRALADLMGEPSRKHPTLPAPAEDGPEPFWHPAMQQAPGTRSGGRRERVPAPSRSDVPPLARLVLHTLLDRTAVFAVTPSGEVASAVVPVGRAGWEARVTELRDALGVTREARGASGLLRLAGARAEAEAERQIGDGEGDGEGDGIGDGDSRVDKPSPDVGSLLAGAFDDLIGPVAAGLPGEGQPLAIEPHGPLWLLPFAALRRPDGLFVGDVWPLVVAPSAAIVEEIRAEQEPPPPAGLSALVVGNPTMPPGTAPLEGAEREAESIAAKLGSGGVELLTGEQATRQAVREAMPRAGIVHLATHGLALASDPLSSFVVLAAGEEASGLFTARDVLDLSLNGLPSSAPGPTTSTDLVVLSACQTGLGKITGDGVIGLSRAFLAAGARTVVVSLWSVSDAATRALMEAFYDRYLEDGDKAAALRHAMRTVRQTPGWEPPRFWAPFVVVGAER